MKTEDAIEHFGTQTKLAAALDTNQSTVASWGEFPPQLRQLQIEHLTFGALKAEPSALPRRNKKYRVSAMEIKAAI